MRALLLLLSRDVCGCHEDTDLLYVKGTTMRKGSSALHDKKLRYKYIPLKLKVSSMP